MATFFRSKTGRGLLLAAGVLAIVGLGPAAVGVAIGLVVLACFVEMASFGNSSDWARGAYGALALQGAIVCFGALAAVDIVGKQGLWLTMVIVSAVFVENAVAQIMGKRFGRRKLFPQYSPNKTIEGALWGWLGGSLAGAIALGLAWWLGGVSEQLAVNWREWLAVIIIAPPLAEIGDWIESRFKRLVGVKDSGDLTRSGPGLLRVISLSPIWGRQGGALDKTDSLWFAMAISWLVLVSSWDVAFVVVICVVAFVMYDRTMNPWPPPPH